MKYNKNWRQQSIERLENFDWGDPSTAPTNLVRRCIELSKVPVEVFSPGDLRVMIAQQIGLPFLVPIAIERLQDNIFTDAELYEGDLLNSVLGVDSSFWDKHETLWRQLNELIKDKRQEIAAMKISLTNFDSSTFASG